MKMKTGIDILQDFRNVLNAAGMHRALAILNGTTDFRFTGVYRFEDDLVVNVTLYDRNNPDLRIGEDVRLQESYCRLTATAGDVCLIEDASSDSRLSQHAARDAVLSYCAVLLTGPDEEALGTLCHFDVRPREIPEAVVELLKQVRPEVASAVAERRGIPIREPGRFRIADFAPGTST